MRGLLYKDFLTLLRQMRLFLLLVVAFALIPGIGSSGFAVLYGISIPISAIAYDERTRWNRLAVMLPFTDGQLVLCKYILSWGSAISLTLLSALGQFVMGALRGGASGGEILVSSLGMCAIALLLIAAVLPTMFRFGTERGRLAFIALIAAAAICFTLGAKSVNLHGKVLAIALLAMSVVANLVSLQISRRVFRKGLRA